MHSKRQMRFVVAPSITVKLKTLKCQYVKRLRQWWPKGEVLEQAVQLLICHVEFPKI